MPTLAIELRRGLEKVVIEARDRAEEAALAALKRLAVDAARPFENMTPLFKSVRRQLRARGLRTGDRRRPDGMQEIERLTEELAYEYWHRMLFARFLAENHLLMHPDGVPVSLAECEDLARDENAPNGYVLAARYASRMLPQIFRVDDVLLEIEFPANDRLPLEKLLASLPAAAFTSDDSLGWVYQFWQAKKKDEVNRSGQKIDGRSLPAVTQLFTEHYMVEFLLHNTIGAWWCARNGVSGPSGGAGVPPGEASVAFDYLRWRDDGTPAAGKFEGWPESLAKFTMLDPCCGSGHFLVAGFRLLVPMRMHDESLSVQEACDAVLRENLFGLELDPRCTQIAAFALALAAWTYPGPDGQPLGYRELPPLNIACSGQGVVGTKEEWTRFANGDSRFREGMERLYDLFRRAPTLGSLIDPRTVTEDLFALGFETLRGTLERALKRVETQTDPDRAAVGVAAQGIAFAASLMTRAFTLVATNVPYLTLGKQAKELRDYIADVYSAAKADLATAFVERCLEYCAERGTIAIVSPQNWWMLYSYSNFRSKLLRSTKLLILSSLGREAFDSFGARGPMTTLIVASRGKYEGHHSVSAIDAFSPDKVNKAELLGREPLCQLRQEQFLDSPDFRISLSPFQSHELLENYASSYWGQGTGDQGRFYRFHWELGGISEGWTLLQGSTGESKEFAGRERIVWWQDGDGDLTRIASELREIEGHNGIRPFRGRDAWNKKGVCISLMDRLSATLYQGHIFDSNCAAIIPHDSRHQTAIWMMCSSPEFNRLVRTIDKKVNVTNATLIKVPFNLDHWQKVAAEQYPNGLPEPHSDDPTQWLFKGNPKSSIDPLHVAVARLLGYRWPAQESDNLDSLTDPDGLVTIPAVRGEPPAAERLQEVLRAAYESEWSASLLDKLLTDSGCRPGTSLDAWLRDSYSEQHCRRFHNRPFIWHIWDGRKDGFSCLVNYHKLNHKALESLTYAYLQDWVNAQTAAAKQGQTGADLRLKAAQDLQEKLKLILAGEPPYDIFVRWKPIDQQPIGWNPDLNDGVRPNIRPFVTAGILRKNPNIKWTKDRGTEPQRPKDRFPWFWTSDIFKGERMNDVHLTNAEKQAARGG